MSGWPVLRFLAKKCVAWYTIIIVSFSFVLGSHFNISRPARLRTRSPLSEVTHSRSSHPSLRRPHHPSTTALSSARPAASWAESCAVLSEDRARARPAHACERVRRGRDVRWSSKTTRRPSSGGDAQPPRRPELTWHWVRDDRGGGGPYFRVSWY